MSVGPFEFGLSEKGLGMILLLGSFDLKGFGSLTKKKFQTGPTVVKQASKAVRMHPATLSRNFKNFT